MDTKMQNLFNNTLQRDVYSKAEDDISDAFTRVVTNFSGMGGPNINVIFPAIMALAWILSTALLSLKVMGDRKLYLMIRKCVQVIITSEE